MLDETTAWLIFLRHSVDTIIMSTFVIVTYRVCGNHCVEMMTINTRIIYITWLSFVLLLVSLKLDL